MRRALSALALGSALAGCAPLGTPAPSTRPPAPSPGAAPARPVHSQLAQAQATHEYPGPAPPRQSAPGSGSPAQAVAAFATAYINWSAATVAADMEALAQASVGQARSAMELAAAQTGSDYELRRGGIANSGVVEAVAALRERPNEYVVVTRERTTATATAAYQGLAPAWHVAVATVVRLGAGRWAVSAWQPES